VKWLVDDPGSHTVGASRLYLYVSEMLVHVPLSEIDSSEEVIEKVHDKACGE
jgi:hypothetical protein